MIQLGGFKTANGNTIVVNLEEVTHFYKNNDNEVIMYLTGGQSIVVADTFEDIVNVFIQANVQEQTLAHQCHCQHKQEEVPACENSSLE